MSSLGVVMVPTNGSEFDAIVGNLECWARPELRPIESPSAHRPTLLFVFNNDLDRYRTQIEAAFTEHSMDRYFGALRFADLDLRGDDDLYERDYEKEVGAKGFKAGPNQQFLSSLQVAAEYGRCAFLMETDCAVVRPGWLERLDDLCDRFGSFWVMGSAYRGVHRLTRRFARHMNGNAVYAAGDPDFQRFVADYWTPQMAHLIETEDRRLAYDCILEWSFDSDEGWPVWQRTAHKLIYTDFIQNISGDTDLREDGAQLLERVRRESPDTFLLHNVNAARAVRADAGRPVPTRAVENKPSAPGERAVRVI